MMNFTITQHPDEERDEADQAWQQDSDAIGALAEVEQAFGDDWSDLASMKATEGVKKEEHDVIDKAIPDAPATSIKEPITEQNPLHPRKADWVVNCPHCQAVNEYDYTMCDPVHPRMCEGRTEYSHPLVCFTVARANLNSRESLDGSTRCLAPEKSAVDTDDWWDGQEPVFF